MFEQAWERQKGLCDICSEPLRRKAGRADSVSRDHCHRRNFPRALLHNRCNWVLGILEKFSIPAERFSEYIRKFETLTEHGKDTYSTP